jgi:hypothetical protein
LKTVKNGQRDGGDRDSSFGRLLAGVLGARSAPGEPDARSAPGEPGARSASFPADRCLDPDTLAAWADDSLSREERRAAEAHAADCARCQGLLAAMVRTAPAPVAAEPAWWRLPALGWLVPVTAAVAAIIIWVIVPGHTPLQRSNSAASSADLRAIPDAPAVAAPAREEQKEKAPSRLRGTIPGKQKPAAPGDAARNAGNARQDTSAKKQSSPLADAAARSETAAASAAAGRVTPKPEERSSPVPSAPAPSSLDSVTALGTARMAAVASGATPGIVIVSADPASRWRIVSGSPGSIVQRSTDGGSTWQPQQTGVSVTIAAGMSPTPSVCWLVGPAGTVLLSTDGRSWRLLGFPEAADLVSVTATDENAATVTARDGHRFSTSDGGLTWVRSGS